MESVKVLRNVPRPERCQCGGKVRLMKVVGPLMDEGTKVLKRTFVCLICTSKVVTLEVLN